MPTRSRTTGYGWRRGAGIDYFMAEVLVDKGKRARAVLGLPDPAPTHADQLNLPF